MEDNTSQTPQPEDNFLGIADRDIINEVESKGIAKAELYIFQLDSETAITTDLVLIIHKIAFEELYEWAGKWRNVNVVVGQLIPPSANEVLHLMYQFIDNMNYKLSVAKTYEDYVACMAYVHYEFVRIHPFTNGNGRTGRILMNFAALKSGYKPIELYHHEGESRGFILSAMRSADKGDFEPLKTLIRKELVAF